MATVNFLYRSTRNNANLIARLLFRQNNLDHVIGANTKLNVTSDYWTKQHRQKQPKSIDIKNKQTEVNTELNNLENYILSAFDKTAPGSINKEWLQHVINEYYAPTVENPTSNELIRYIDIYINERRSEITPGTVKTCGVIKENLLRYQSQLKKPILISDVDLAFKLDFENYCLGQGYAPNTIARAIRFVKTVCLYARSKRIDTSYQLDSIKASYKKVDNIHLTFSELENIENIPTPLPDYLENARQWLIISCYVGQRVSDFMRFNKSMVISKANKDGILKHYIEFTQVKTGKIMTLPLHKKVLDILEKNEGNFPRPISDINYNVYIKTVCQKAKITSLVKGSKKTETAEGSKIYRKALGSFEKWELVSSHIGRRSFATNFYNVIPTPLLMAATGHTTEAMFLNYIGKGQKDLAEALAEHF